MTATGSPEDIWREFRYLRQAGLIVAVAGGGGGGVRGFGRSARRRELRTSS